MTDARQEQPHDDSRWRELFASTEHDAAPIDRDALARLRTMSAEAFLSSVHGSAARTDEIAVESESDDGDVSSDRTEPRPSIDPDARKSKRRNPMLTLGLRLTGMAAAAIGVAVTAWLASPSNNEPTLGEALDRLMASSAVQGRFDAADSNNVIEISEGRLRWDREINNVAYTRLIDGPRQWDIAWSENRATSSSAPLVDIKAKNADEPSKALNLAAALELPMAGEAWSKLRAARPKTITREGQRLLLYDVDCPGPRWRVNVQATVDPGTQFLRSMEFKIQEPTTVEPLVRLTFEEIQDVFDEDRFIVGDSLTEDGRIGKTIVSQGVVTVRPRIETNDPLRPRRHSPVASGLILMPGDVVTTSARGANALLVRLVPDVFVTIGPNSTVRLDSPMRIQVLQGEIQIEASKEHPLVVATDDGDVEQAITDKAILRVGKPRGQDGTTVVRLDKAPKWLQGFEGAVNDESIGSLVANVDGRDVPLTVGYHKVTVDIRDQIARTSVEESFVNHTDGTLEGTFYFPLPQDASISGFGMWINGELVEADIVEKQRAREIYETILRERRDPGLLEWTGGNLFKARVFPILPHSEKRIKITYTQVLPMENGRYRYGYGLQSELLKQHPLRQLNIDVTISSAKPIAKVHCPTHAALIDRTEHAAKVSFEAQEYTPTRDFEVVVEPNASADAAALIPHRRGADGYFLLQLTPPNGASESAGWSRDIVPSGHGPMRLMLVCDTSGSMDADARARQTEVVETLLRCLSENDTFDVAVADVDCTWLDTSADDPTEKRIDAVLASLDERRSLGWTDLDKAVGDALDRALDVRHANTHIVYIGDGVQNTFDADASAAAARLRKAYDDRIDADAPIRPTFHAVSVGSSYESVVLNAIASLGGGSVRHVSAEEGPAKAALRLLQEISAPGMKDIRVSFEGVRTARVYPETIPNLASGKQQILLGRYLPEGEDQQGEVVVTGTLDGEPVRFTAPITLRDAEQGNSFVPRLWARMHLDALLQQGSSKAIQDEIIALSEEYHIITPYTSLLVLESDEDRERFGVTRRMMMTDGERFFAQGREDANYELLQKYMQEAAAYRIGLRRTALSQLATMGREDYAQLRRAAHQWSWGDADERKAFQYDSTVLVTQGDVSGIAGAMNPMGNLLMDGYASGGRISGREMLGRMPMSEVGGDGREWFDTPMPLVWDAEPGEKAKSDRGFKKLEDIRVVDMDVDYEEVFEEVDALAYSSASTAPMGGPAPATMPMRSSLLRSNEPRSRTRGAAGYYMFGLSDAKEQLVKQRYDQAPRDSGIAQPYWVESLFPGVSGAATVNEVECDWPEEIQSLCEDLLRTDDLLAEEGGWRVAETSETFDPRWGELTSKSRVKTLLSKDAWLLRTESDGGQTTVSWCDREERGAMHLGPMLGRTRSSTENDLAQLPISLPGFMTTDIRRTHRGFNASMRTNDDGDIVLTLIHKDNDKIRRRITIHPKWMVVRKIEHLAGDKTTSRIESTNFVRVGGRFFPTLVFYHDAEGEITRSTAYEYERLDDDALDAAISEGMAPRDDVLFLAAPGPSLTEAKQAKADGKAAFQDHYLLLAHFASTNQNERVWEEWTAAKALAGDKPGAWELENLVLRNTRRHEELKQRILARIEEVLQSGDPRSIDDTGFYRLEQLRNEAQSICSTEEALTLLERIKPIHDVQPRHTNARLNWQSTHINYLKSLGWKEVALEEARDLMIAFPHDANAQQAYLQLLVDRGDQADAVAFVEETCVPERKWRPYEISNIRNALLSSMENKRRFQELVPLLEKLYEQEPPSDSYSWNRLLSAMILGGRADEAWGLMRRWMKDARVEDAVSPVAAAKLDAAVEHAFGDGRNLYSGELDIRFTDDLAETALFFARHDKEYGRAERILTHYRFRDTDRCEAVVAKISRRLRKDFESLPPDMIRSYVTWGESYGDRYITDELRRELIDAARPRFEQAKSAEDRRAFENLLFHLLSSEAFADERLALRRSLWEKAPENERNNRAEQLFHELIARPWSESVEDEIYGMIPYWMEILPEKGDPRERTVARLQALQMADDWVLRQYATGLDDAIESPHELTWIELAGKKSEHQRAALARLVDRLENELRRQDPALHAWIDMERVYFGARLPDADVDALASLCWERLGRHPRKLSLDNPLEFMLESTLANRSLVSLMNLSCRRSANASLVDDVLAYLDEACAMSGGNLEWRMYKYQMLVALDRPGPLAEALRAWSAEETRPNPWRTPLAYLLAEKGTVEDLKEAVDLLEQVRADDELGPTDYRALGNWRLALNQREEYEQARMAVYETMEEWTLRNFIDQDRRRYSRSDETVPEEFDPEILLAMHALMRKAESPHNHAWLFGEFYQEVRDFRLLFPLADAVTGHTSGAVYDTLGNFSSITSRIQEEATVNEVVAHVDEVRATVELDADLRSLDLLECLVERRAAELMNQPGPHGDRAVAAMQRAFDREWSEHEPKRMSGLLYQFGRINYAPLRDEQLREFEELLAMTQSGTVDRLEVAVNWSRTLYNSYGRHDEAVDLIEAELTAFIAAHDGRLTPEADDAFLMYVDFLAGTSRYAKAEGLLRKHIDADPGRERAYRFTTKLFEGYRRAFEGGGAVSFGSSENAATKQAFYEELVRRFANAADADDASTQQQVIDQFMQVFRAAERLGVEGYKADLREFAFERLPEMIEIQADNMHNVYGNVSYTLRDLVGVEDALEMLIVAIEREPDWMRFGRSYRTGWSQHNHRLGEYRTDLKTLKPALEERLLAIVVDALRDDLTNRSGRSRVIYSNDTSYFWSEKADEFARVADEVFEECKDSERGVVHVASYVYGSLDRYARAIEMLADAHRRGVLREDGRSLLADYLYLQNRFEESIPVLVELIEMRPDNVSYRARLMRSYYGAKRYDDLVATLDASEQHFRDGERWTEDVLRTLAQVCQETRRDERGVVLFEELIPWRQRSRQDRGIGDGVLSDDYRRLALCYSGLGQTGKAVEAASGAIVSWGKNLDNRRSAVASLQQVMRESGDLDAYVVEMEAQVAETGLDSPVVRKALGRVLQEKGKHAEALKHLRISVELQPNDPEVHRYMLECCDAMNDRPAAVETLFEAILVSRRELSLYTQLAERLDRLEQSGEAERARTSIVEAMPNETESHTKLAEIRQSQDRWGDAIRHWEQVAELRRLEPTGLLKLAEALMHERRWDAMEDVLDRLEAKKWPDRFGDVKRQAEEFRRMWRLNKDRPTDDPDNPF